MSKLVVVVFPDAGRAEEGAEALEDLHDAGELTLYAAAILAKKPDGETTLRRLKTPGPLAAAVTALIGGLVGLVGGPPVAALGAAAGAVSGGWIDAVKLGARADFLDEVARELTPGKAALLAEVSEDRLTPLDMRMEALGGRVLREGRPDFEEDQIERETAAQTAELAQLEAEHASAGEELKARFEARFGEIRRKLHGVAARANERIARLREETEAKTAELERQAAAANPEAKARIERRLAEARAADERRSAKLRRSLESANEALREAG